MRAKELLVRYLKDHKHLTAGDQLYYTKEFLDNYKISQSDFFKWIFEEAKQFNYDINSDKSVRIFLQ